MENIDARVNPLTILTIRNTFEDLDKAAIKAFADAGNDPGPTEQQVLTAAREGNEDVVRDNIRTLRRIESEAKEFLLALQPDTEEKELIPGGWVNLGSAEKPDPCAKWVCKGLIREGLPALLVGHGEAGKGILISGLAMGVAAGGDFLGQPCSLGKVLIVSAEDDTEELVSRCLEIHSVM